MSNALIWLLLGIVSGSFAGFNLGRLVERYQQLKELSQRLDKEL